ncbi:MAG TPA: EamA family transporter [Gemmatimonadaceae bacterium]|jgi:drug/metabolite transporter (DMT)-like permease
MGSTAGESATPGHATSITRPGVWLTELSLVLMALIWGVNFSVVKFGTTLVDPLAYNGVRASIAALLLCTIVGVGRMPLPSGRTIVALLLLGALGNGIYQYFFVEGIARTSASDTALIVAASPAFTAIIGRMMGVERLNRQAVLGVVGSIAGIVLVVIGSSKDEGGTSMVGLALVLCGSLAWALYTVMLKPHTERVANLPLSAITMVGGAIPLFVVAWPAVSRAHWTAPALWGAIGYSAVFSLVIAYYFWYRGVRIIGPTRTAIYSNLQPVIAVLVAWAMLGEVPTVWQVLGTVCIVGSLMLARS